jgi:subtilase family serine protease
MSIAAGPPPQLSPGEAKTFGVPMIVRQATSAAHPLHYLVDATADPANLILESNEQNNTSFHVFDSKKTCL